MLVYSLNNHVGGAVLADALNGRQDMPSLRTLQNPAGVSNSGRVITGHFTLLYSNSYLLTIKNYNYETDSR